MKKCSNPEHPHCTFWVLPGENVCAGNHPQTAVPASSYDLLNALRSARSEQSATAPVRAPAACMPAAAASAPLATPSAVTPVRPASQAVQPHLHISGFDPRAAGGRQTLKMELRGMAAQCAPQLALRLRSDLIPRGFVQHDCVRATRGDWRPVFVEFSSRNKEHGQYQIDVEVHSHVDGAVAQKWVCTFVILVPRRDATLTEIHQIFLSTHKTCA